jgi:hypothetical protein
MDHAATPHLESFATAGLKKTLRDRWKLRIDR